jgi:hypothetical protein
MKHPKYLIENGFLYRLKPNRLEPNACLKQLALPAGLRRHIISLAHDDVHCGRGKTLDRIHPHFAFPREKILVSKYIRNCRNCQLFAPVKTAERQTLRPIKSLPIPFSECYMDLLEAPINAGQKTKCLLVYVCGHSKFVVLKVLYSKKVDAIVQSLLEIMTAYAIPSRLHFDQSSVNMSRIMMALRKRLGIQDCPTAVGLHHGTGLVEKTI